MNMTIAVAELVEALCDARQGIYAHEQNLLSQCREDAAKIQTLRLRRIDSLISHYTKAKASQ